MKIEGRRFFTTPSEFSEFSEFSENSENSDCSVTVRKKPA